MPVPDVPASTRALASSRAPTRTLPLAAAALLLGLACTDPASDPRPPDPVEASSDDPVVAYVDGAAIRADAVDGPLRLDLHDLEQAAYARRLERIETLARERLGSGIEPGSPEWNARVELRLEPPEPPRLAIPPSPGPSLGPETAPVTLVAFVDFESPHCRRLQPVLRRVLDEHPDAVRLEIRDLPLPYHRRAFDAAKAARCAGEQDAYWAYHDRLLLEQPAFAPADLERHAARLDLDPERFAACLAAPRQAERIRTDVALAASLGVHRAPTLFVNGLYLAGDPSFEAIERLLGGELERIARASPSSPSSPDSAARTPSRVPSSALVPEAEAQWPHLAPEEMPEPELVLNLDRKAILRALEDRRRLDEKLEASSGRFSGRRLLKLRRVDEDDLYGHLGLEPGDVLLLIDGRFVTAGSDRLWDALAESDGFTLLVMRRGRPHSFRYQIR